MQRCHGLLGLCDQQDLHFPKPLCETHHRQQCVPGCLPPQEATPRNARWPAFPSLGNPQKSFPPLDLRSLVLSRLLPGHCPPNGDGTEPSRQLFPGEPALLGGNFPSPHLPFLRQPHSTPCDWRNPLRSTAVAVCLSQCWMGCALGGDEPCPSWMGKGSAASVPGSCGSEDWKCPLHLQWWGVEPISHHPVLARLCQGRNRKAS